MNNKQLTKNFYLSEFIISQTATRLGIENKPNTQVIENLTILCKNVLQPLRDHFKKPVIINSGYRSPQLNKAVKGSSTSQHMTGHAADIIINSIDNYDLASWIKSNLNYDQLILEYYSGKTTGWVHVSYAVGKNRKQNLTINSKGIWYYLKPF